MNPSLFPPFESLTPIPQNTDYIELLRELSINAINPLNKYIQIKTITDLRRVRKYQIDFFKVCFDNIIERFINNYIHSNSNEEISLCALLFFDEMFNDEPWNFNERWIDVCYSTLMDLIQSSTNVNISNAAKNAVKNLYVNMHHTSKITNTFRCFKNKYNEYNDELLKYIEQNFYIMLSEIDVTNLIYMFDWNYIVEYIKDYLSDNNAYFYYKRCFDALKVKVADRWENEFMLKVILQEDNRNIINKICNS
jgi:hypothetical protein